MKPVANFAVIALASALLTPMVVGAVGSTSPAQAVEPAMKTTTTTTTAPVAAAEPVCARKVKVVYAGYAGATGCAPAQ
jgi:hypothetical protein